MRFPTRAAIDRLNSCLGLVEDPSMQDWELECADPNRVEEFLNFHDTHTTSDDEKFTLMALILGSFEEYHAINPSDASLWLRIRSILSDNVELYRTHIEYYQWLEAESEEEYFPITPLMRQIEIQKEAEQGGGADAEPAV